MLRHEEIAALVERLGVEPQRTGGVLLVDDERLNTQVLRAFLEDAWQVHEAASGEEALEIAGTAPLDVVVADQRMPGMTGVELLAQLRTRRPDVAGIVLTGYTDVQALESAINRANVFRFLRKPIEPQEILQAIEQASTHVVQRRTIERLVTLLARRSDELHDSLEQIRRQQEALLHLERLGTVGQLSSGITHDLRNVVSALRTAEWEMGQLTAVSPDLREFLALGLAGVDNLLGTLQTIHEFARSGELTLQLDPVDPAEVVRDALSITRMDLRYRMRKVHADVAPRLPRIRADRQKITQVLVNLLRNALHATDKGGEVWISAVPRTGAVVLAVEDDGPGIAPELRERLFQPFASTKGKQGLGMGLYMARLIAESHRGEIRAVPATRKGARFELSIPAVAGTTNS